jgi:hypothetical protein
MEPVGLLSARRASLLKHANKTVQKKLPKEALRRPDGVLTAGSRACKHW